MADVVTQRRRVPPPNRIRPHLALRFPRRRDRSRLPGGLASLGLVFGHGRARRGPLSSPATCLNIDDWLPWFSRRRVLCDLDTAGAVASPQSRVARRATTPSRLEEALDGIAEQGRIVPSRRMLWVGAADRMGIP